MILPTGRPVRLIPAHAGKTSSRSPATSKRRAHPRSRGENAPALFRARRWRGSSPLTRGKLLQVAEGERVHGLIPAHAGKTYEAHALAIQTGDHPHSRGENRGYCRTSGNSAGSSPLMRGKRKQGCQVNVVQGLIPAHAGKTRPMRLAGPGRRAHPRSRGENVKVSVVADTKKGSSPLTRGKPHPRVPHRTRRGIIPAHAGKTTQNRPGSSSRRDHPRSRGENLRLYGLGAMNEGSSPLTRGKPVPASWLGQVPGIIPAHAGKTPPRTRSPRGAWDHPRSRGENWRVPLIHVATVGSSPLARGKRTIVTVYWLVRGLIPAHTGKTTWRPAWIAASWAHPRSHGENEHFVDRGDHERGSSPLTRGKP